MISLLLTFGCHGHIFRFFFFFIYWFLDYIWKIEYVCTILISDGIKSTVIRLRVYFGWILRFLSEHRLLCLMRVALVLDSRKWWRHVRTIYMYKEMRNSKLLFFSPRRPHYTAFKQGLIKIAADVSFRSKRKSPIKKKSVLNLGLIAVAFSSPVYVPPREETATRLNGKACLWSINS